MAGATITPSARDLESTLFEQVNNLEGHAKALNEIKKVCMQLNGSLANKAWLVGDAITLADMAVFCAIVPAYQLSLDPGFRKATPALDKWFLRIASLPIVARHLGFVKTCERAVTPFKG